MVWIVLAGACFALVFAAVPLLAGRAVRLIAEHVSPPR